jgi:phosphohistidine phosphatase SixA
MRADRPSPWRQCLITLFASGLATGLSPIVAFADDTGWTLLGTGGQVILMRHALTDPGAGDPPGFTLGDCATQRNLSTRGRDEARRIGDAFRQRKILVERVLSSRWCRCLETARLAFGTVEPWPPLDSIFIDRSRESEQSRAVRARIAEHRGPGTLVLVTHGANISALVGIVPAAGELVVVTPDDRGGLRVAGRIHPEAARTN